VELRQLEHVLAVIEEGSFSGAAARPYMVQSSLSASLLAPERELAQSCSSAARSHVSESEIQRMGGTS
jgi:hypothetical protein